MPIRSGAQGSRLTAAATADVDFAGGTKAVKYIMKASASDGSFPVPSNANGTDNSNGTLYPATRVFTPGGALIFEGDFTDYPAELKWIKKFGVTLTGQDNKVSTTSTTQACARFASASDTGVTCDFDSNGGTAEVPCGAPEGYFRTSEADCTAPVIVGSGSQNDNIQIRLEVDRAQLGSKENLMVVVEYVASNIRAADPDPTKCYNSTLRVFDPTDTQCSDQSWQVFLKRSNADNIIPFLTMIPPARSFIDAAKNSGGGTPVTRQIILPIAGDPDLSVFQISRMKSMNPATSFACPSNSALCLGVVFYSVTIFRI